MKIGLLVYPGCVSSGLFAFAELMEVANKRSGKNVFNISWIGAGLNDVPISAGGKTPVSTIKVSATIGSEELDAILIPGFWTNYQKHVEQSLKANHNIISALKKLPVSTKLWSYCTGVCMHAESGRLDQKNATATWWIFDYVEYNYSKVNWSFTQTCLFQAGSATASGLNGYLPIAQTLIENYCGNDVLKDIVELMILPKPEIIAQPFKQIKLIKLEDKLLRSIFIWVEKTPANELPLSALSAELNQTERTLARKVKLVTKLSCVNFMRLIKLHQAGEYLIYSQKTISAISNILGFTDDAVFRRSFKNASTFTPGKYRSLFQREFWTSYKLVLIH